MERRKQTRDALKDDNKPRVKNRHRDAKSVGKRRQPSEKVAVQDVKETSGRSE